MGKHIYTLLRKISFPNGPSIPLAAAIIDDEWHTEAAKRNQTDRGLPAQNSRPLYSFSRARQVVLHSA